MEDKDCTQIAKLCFEFWKAQYGHFEDFIKFIQNIGWLTSSAGLPVIYIIKFFTTLQDYMCSETDKVWVYDRRHMRKRQISFRRPSLKRDTWQSSVATFLNFIHQRDAYIAMLVVFQLLIKAIPIYTVHDNFITTAGYSDLIAKCYSQKKQHRKIDYNEMVIAREKQEGKEQENKKDEKDKKKKKKPRKKLTDGEIYMYQKEWWELGNLIQAVGPNEVILTNVLYAILDQNMPICDPSTGVEWSPAKKKAWKEKI
ncbi:DNA-dependent RNA polymerase [Tanacetum coccineum]